MVSCLPGHIMKWTQLIPLIFTGKLNYREKVLLRMQNVHTQLLEYHGYLVPLVIILSKQLLKASQTKNSLEIVNDQWGKPTYGLDLARALLSRIEHPNLFKYETYHYAQGPKQIGLG